jgi:hypothetical protein
VSAPKDRLAPGDGGGAAAPAPEKDAPEPEEELWFYVDLLKVLQGPFTTPQMKLWLNAGYLPDDLEVRLSTEASFTPLRFRKHEIDPSFPKIQQTAASPRENHAASSQSQSPQAPAAPAPAANEPEAQPQFSPRATQPDLAQKSNLHAQPKAVSPESLVRLLVC